MSLTLAVEDIVAESSNPLLAAHPSWSRVPLGQIATVLNGFAFKSQRFGKLKGTPLIRIRDVGKSKTDCLYDGPFDQRYLIHSGDLIVGMDGDFKCARWTSEPALLNQRVCKIQLTSRDYDLRFLELVLPGYLKAINERTSSQTVQHLSSRSLLQIPLPFPPPDEQNRIVERINALLDQINSTSGRLSQVRLILKRFRQAILAAACSGRLTEDWRYKRFSVEETDSELPSGWQWKTVEELIPPGGMFDGPFGSNLKTSDYTDSGVRVIRLENIGHLRFIPEKQAYISQPKYKTLTKHTVGEDDIIFASFIEEAIRVCLLPKLPTLAIAKADCFCLRPLSDIDRSYLVLQLASPESYVKLAENIHGATRPRINISQLRKLQVRVCSPDEQREIVRRVRALFTLADQIAARANQAQARVDQLAPSLLAKAFRGELAAMPVAENYRRSGG